MSVFKKGEIENFVDRGEKADLPVLVGRDKIIQALEKKGDYIRQQQSPARSLFRFHLERAEESIPQFLSVMPGMSNSSSSSALLG